MSSTMLSATRTSLVTRPARSGAVRVQASAHPKEIAKENKTARRFQQAAAAALAALVVAAPVMADVDENVKTAVCASNATAKICLKDSGKK